VVPSVPARRLIQRFQVTGQLGTGARGAVYRARDPQLGRDVAIKVLTGPAAQASDGLSPHDTVDLRGDARAGAPASELLDEARIMARLSHPNVLPVYEIGIADGELFVVMEHIAGSDLRSWLERPHSTREIISLFTQAARGLAAAHAHGIVHRDFKPENVLVGEDGRVRVADFGLSRLRSHLEPALRVERPSGGTPYYMAPELWRGQPATERSDVFALCTALAEALGNEPAERDELDRALRARGVGRRLRAAIAAGLAEDAEKRPGVDEVIAALAERGPAWRSRWPIAAVAAVAAGVAIFIAASGGQPACQADRVRFAGAWGDERRAALAAFGLADEVDDQRGQLTSALRTVCEGERSGQLSAAQARIRTSCLERRGIELDLAATLVVARKGTAAARDLVDLIPLAAECEQMVAPALPADRAPVAALYRRALEAALEPLGSPAPNVALAAIEREAKALGERELEARAAVWLGMRQIETDQLTAADASFARAYDLAMAINATGTAVDALVERGIAAGKRGDPAVRYTYSKLAVELADKSTATIGTRVFVYRGLAQAELERGQPGRAIDLAEKTLALLRKAPDPHTERAARYVMIQALHQLGGQEAVALEIARENLEATRKTLGERDADYGTALNVVAVALRHVGDHAGALDYRRRALAVMQGSLPADHSAVIGQQMNVALDLHANGRFEEARAMAIEHVAIADRNESMREWRSSSLADLGAITFATGRVEEGMRLFEEGLDGLVSQVGQDHPDALGYRLQRAYFELELGRLDDAERHLEALERSYRSRTDQARALARLDGIYRARLALARKQPRDAETRARAALASWRELRGDEGEREELLRVLATSLVDQGKFAEALDVLTAAEGIARARRELDHRFALIDIERGRALVGLGRKAEAADIARKARAVLERFPGELRGRADADALLARLR
jgi:tetratricopeptide (TPR) repeat protein